MDQTHTLLEVEDDGIALVMSDGSQWEVAVGDNTITIIWLPTGRLHIEKSQDPLYPYLITNLDTSGPDKIRARRL